LCAIFCTIALQFKLFGIKLKYDFYLDIIKYIDSLILSSTDNSKHLVIEYTLNEQWNDNALCTIA